MRHHQIPAKIQDVLNWRHEVWPWRFGRQQIATPSVMAVTEEGIADAA
jgi:hypothetical protein